MRESSKKPESEAGELLRAVQDLTAVVSSLNKILEEDYPKREEIERNYATKQHIRNRRIAFAGATISAIVISYFLTVSTVVYCFHDGAPGQRYKSTCSVFPGYDASQQGNDNIIAEFRNLQGQVDESTDLLMEIKAKLDAK